MGRLEHESNQRFGCRRKCAIRERPSFTKEEREKLKQIRTQLDAYLAQNMDKFIVTDGALKDWDNFVKQLKAKGADDIVKIYNDALARVK